MNAITKKAHATNNLSISAMVSKRLTTSKNWLIGKHEEFEINNVFRLDESEREINHVRVHPSLMAKFDRDEIVCVSNGDKKVFIPIKGGNAKNQQKSPKTLHTSYNVMAAIGAASPNKKKAIIVRKMTRWEKISESWNGSNVDHRGYFIGIAGVVLAILQAIFQLG